MAVDLLGPTNQGLANLTNTFATLAQLKRQEALDARSAADNEQIRELRALQIGEARRGIDERNRLSSRLSSLQPYYTVDGKQPATFAESIQPGSVNEMGVPVEKPSPFKLQQPNMTDRLQIMADEASRGNQTAAAQLPGIINLDEQLAKMEAEVQMGGGDRRQFLIKKQQFEQGKEMIKTLAPIAKVPSTRGIAEKLLMGYKQMQPDNPIVKNMTLDDFSVQDDQLVVNIKDPESGKLIGHNILDPETGTMKFQAAKQDTSITEFETFLSAGRKGGKSDTQILDEWNNREMGRKKAGASKVEVNTGKADTTGVETVVRELPKMKDAAETANNARGKLGEMKRLLAGGAGGASGFAKATLAPWLESVGISTKGLDDAALYQSLARTLAGSMRIDIVGPGPVSNYEQGLLEKVSGGGVQATRAATELLNHYDKIAERKVNSYNATVDQLGKTTPETSKFYPRIGADNKQTGKTGGKSGKVGKYSYTVE